MKKVDNYIHSQAIQARQVFKIAGKKLFIVGEKNKKIGDFFGDDKEIFVIAAKKTNFF